MAVNGYNNIGIALNNSLFTDITLKSIQDAVKQDAVKEEQTTWVEPKPTDTTKQCIESPPAVPVDKSVVLAYNPQIKTTPTVSIGGTVDPKTGDIQINVDVKTDFSGFTVSKVPFEPLPPEKTEPTSYIPPSGGNLKLVPTFGIDLLTGKVSTTMDLKEVNNPWYTTPVGDSAGGLKISESKNTNPGSGTDG